MPTPEDFSEFLRATEARRVDADRVARAARDAEQRAKTQANAERLAAQQEERRLRTILGEDAARVAMAARGNVPENVLQRRRLLTHRIGWLVGTNTTYAHIGQSDYDFSPSHFGSVSATVLLKDGELKIATHYTGFNDPSKASPERPLRVIDNNLFEPGRIDQDSFERFRGQLAAFVLDNGLHVQ